MKKFKVAVCDSMQKGKVMTVVVWECSDLDGARTQAETMSNEAMSFVVLGLAY